MSTTWKSLKRNPRTHIFKIHHYLINCQGRSFLIEVQESPDGEFVAHAENTSDPHDAIPSYSKSSLEDALGLMIMHLEERYKNEASA